MKPLIFTLSLLALTGCTITLWLNTRFTLSWQCRGVAVPQIMPLYY